MAMNPGMKMMMMQRMTDKPRQQSEYGGNRRMIGYDRNEMTGGMENRYEANGPMYGGWHEPPMNGYPTSNWPERDRPESRRRRSPRTGRYIRGEYGGMDDDDDDDYRPKSIRGNSYGDIYAKGTIYAPGAMNRPGGESKHYGEVDEHKAREWVMGMSDGEHFKLEHSEAQRQAVCPDCDKWEFYVAINAMYSDYCKTAKKFNLDRPEFYAMLARDFLMDEDAAPHKLEKYMETIPKK